MENVNGEQPVRRGGRRMLLIVGGSTFVVVLIVLSVVAFLFLRGLSRPGEATAHFMPRDTMAYVSVNLRPGAGQLKDGREFLSIVQTDDFLDKRDELLDELEDETGIHLLDDVGPWVGTHASFALLDAGEGEPEWVLMVEVGDRDAALDFVGDFLSYLEEEVLRTRFDDDDYRGAELWSSEDEPLALGLTEKYFLMAGGEDVMKEILRNLDSPPSRSLLENGSFSEARDSLPSERVLFMYARGPELFDSALDMFDPYGGWERTAAQVEDDVPEYVAGSASFVKRGMRFDFVGEAASGGFSIDSTKGLESARVVPEDTVLFLAAGGFGEAWDEFRDSMEEFDPYSADEFETFVDEMEDEIGIDLERDVIDSLTGEMAFALLPSTFRWNWRGGFESGILEVLWLVGLEDSREIEDALDDFSDMVEDFGADFDRDSLGDYEVVMADLSGFGPGFGGFEAGYLVTDDWVAVGSTRGSLEAFHDTVSGDSDSLDSVGEYSRLADMVMAPAHLLFYADLAVLLELVEDSLDEETREEYESDVRPFVEQLSGFLAGGSLTREEVRFTAVVMVHE